MRGRIALSPLLFFAFSTALFIDVTAQGDSFILPGDTKPYPASSSPGFMIATKNCLICHSAEYVLTAPPDMSREYWGTVIEKMKKVFGAPIDDRDIVPLVEYLLEINRTER